MKKVSFVFIICLAFLFVGCGDSDPGITYPDDENEEVETQDDEDTVEENDGNQIDDTEEEPDEPEQPEEDPTDPTIDTIGNFSLNFSGQINTTISMQSRGGQGAVNFMYNGMPLAFQEINVMNIDIFPLAMVNSGNIIVLWLDSFGVSDAMSAVEKQVFGISLPQNAEAGSGTMKDINSYAFYGDITVNIQGGAFNVKCVRAVSDRGEYNIDAIDSANIAFSANGDLFDPALAGSMIPYPACE